MNQRDVVALRAELVRRRDKAIRQRRSGDPVAMARLDAVRIDMRRQLGEADPDTLLCELSYCEECLRPGLDSYIHLQADDLHKRMIDAGVVDEQALSRARLLDALALLNSHMGNWGYEHREDDPDRVVQATGGATGDRAIDVQRRTQAASEILTEINAASLEVARAHGAPSPVECGDVAEDAARLFCLDRTDEAVISAARLGQPELADDNQVLWRLLGGYLGVWERDRDMVVELAATSRPDPLVNADGSMAQPDEGTSSDQDSGDDVAAYTWQHVGIARLPESAPSWRIVTEHSNWLRVYTGPVSAFRCAMVGSERWEVEEREFPLPDSEREREALEELDRLGGLVCFLDAAEPDGAIYLSPPALLLGHGINEDTERFAMVSLRDTTLQPVPIDNVPFPLDAVLLERAATTVGGLLRRTLLDLWSLDVFCPRCGELGSGQVHLGEGYLIGGHICRRCRYRWPEQVSPELTDDPENIGPLAWWTIPVTTTLAPLSADGWNPDPFAITWDWDNGVQMTTHYRHGEAVIKVTVDPEAMTMTLIGPLDLGPEGVQMTIDAGPKHARKALSLLISAAEAGADEDDRGQARPSGRAPITGPQPSAPPSDSDDLHITANPAASGGNDSTMRGTTTRETVMCPNCGSSEVWPILYGYPDAIYDRVMPGGCMIPPEAPDSCCQSCGHQYDVAGGWDPTVWQEVELDDDPEMPEWLK